MRTMRVVRRLLALAVLSGVLITGCSSAPEADPGAAGSSAEPTEFVPRGDEPSGIAPAPSGSFTPAPGFSPSAGAPSAGATDYSAEFPILAAPSYKDFTVDELLAGGVSQEAALTMAVGKLVLRALVTSSPLQRKVEMSSGLAQRAGTIEVEALRLNLNGVAPKGVLFNEVPLGASTAPGDVGLRDLNNTLTVLFENQQCVVSFNNSHPQPEEYMWVQLYPEPIDTAKTIKCTPV